MELNKKNNYTFTSVCRCLSSRKYDKGQIPQDIKLFIEIGACFFAAPAGAASTTGTLATSALSSILAIIVQKGKILDAAKRVIEILRNGDPSYMDKYERMMGAYAILWIASFFDAFERIIPDEMLKKIQLATEEKKVLANTLYHNGLFPEDEITYPSLSYSIDEVYDRLGKIYTKMTERLRSFIYDLSFLEKAEEKDICVLEDRLHKLPQAAIETFRDQYLTLYAHYVEFAAFVDLEKERERNAIYAQSVLEVKDLIELRTNNILMNSSRNESRIEKMLLSLGETQRENEVKSIVDNIKRKYKKVIGRSIVDKDRNENHLEYPSIEESFIPQNYQLQECTSRDMRFELESLWQNCKIQRDMSNFWLQYLFDYQSISRLLLILGDPGSGKSRLTEIVSATVSSDAELVIRIPLREYVYYISKKDDEYDDYIERIICKQIKKDGDPYEERIRSFKWITGTNPSRPVTLIFDGYDEIQQATGQPYSTFLNDLSEFQTHCWEEGRPVRIVVTSRRTLIDKADIPLQTLVMKLLPFETEQKQQWIDIWNSKNHNILRAANLNDFMLPEGDEKIQELASQPLLLLMLAIYDADFEKKRNVLQEAKEETGNTLNRAHLYNDLIRRFIHRELCKGKKGKADTYKEIKEKDRKEEMVDAEIEKLGIAALGMFIREKLWITVSELDNDFGMLDAEMTIYEAYKPLDAGEIFPGSFFFIHDATINEDAYYEEHDQEKTEYNDYLTNYKKDSSFVFLHKTFYEFLVADYILNKFYKRIIMHEMGNGKKDKYKDAIFSIDKQLFIALNGSPLCAEPEITTMIIEWCTQKQSQLLMKKEVNLGQQLVSMIEDMIEENTERIKKGTYNIDKNASLLPDRTSQQQNSLYILNLITLMVLINREWRTDLHNWQFLSQYIKLFSPNPNRKRSIIQASSMLDSSEELPLRFMTLFQIKKQGDYIIIKKRDSLMELSNKSPLETKSEVFRYLQDHISDAIYSLHGVHISNKDKQELLKLISESDPIINLVRETEKLRNTIRYGQLYDTDQLKTCLNCFLSLLNDGWKDDREIVSWLRDLHRLEFHYFLPDDIVSGSDPLRPIYLIMVEIAQGLYRLSENNAYNRYQNERWDTPFVLWLSICKTYMPSRPFTGLVLILCDGLNVSSCSGTALYEIVNAIEYIYDSPYFLSNGRHITDEICKKGVRWLGFDHGPKWYAAILKLYRIIPPRSLSYFDVYYSYKLDGFEYHRTIQNKLELPCLLREFLLNQENDIVKEQLKLVEVNSFLVSLSEIYEYISLADAVGDIRFLHEVYRMVNPAFTGSYCNFRVFLHVACALLTHDFPVECSLHDIGQFDDVVIQDPVIVAKLIVELSRPSKSNCSLSEIVNLRKKVMGHMKTIHQRSPQVAIELMCIPI